MQRKGRRDEDAISGLAAVCKRRQTLVAFWWHVGRICVQTARQTRKSKRFILRNTGKNNPKCQALALLPRAVIGVPYEGRSRTHPPSPLHFSEIRLWTRHPSEHSQDEIDVVVLFHGVSTQWTGRLRTRSMRLERRLLCISKMLYSEHAVPLRSPVAAATSTVIIIGSRISCSHSN